MEKRWDVLGIGVAAVDDLLYVDQYPQPDQKIPVKESRRQGGGLTATALVTVARLGGKAGYCARLGEDELSLYTLQELEREGVDCHQVQRSQGVRPFYSVIINDLSTGTRTIFYSGQGYCEPDAEWVNEELVENCKALLIDSFAMRSGIRAAEFARAANIPVIVDAELPIHSGLDQLIRFADHLIIGTGLGASLTAQDDPPEMVRALASPGRACTVITAGEQGCWYAVRDGAVQHCQAYPVQVVDTTGCGDVFHGAYAAALVVGESISRAIHIAAAAAAIKATQPGGRNGIPNMNTILRFIEERPE